MSHFKIFTGPMFGGKTTKLLGAIDRYKYQGREILTFKPRVDERYSRQKIVTHWGGHSSAQNVSTGAEILALVSDNEYDNLVIAIDEVFMIPGSGEALIYLFKRGHTILVSSLQLSSIPEPYDELLKILPWATEITVCPAVCTTCGADAYYTLKKGGDLLAKIEIGGSDLYEPRCFHHFF